jgi:hypothetical protein
MAGFLSGLFNKETPEERAARWMREAEATNAATRRPADDGQMRVAPLEQPKTAEPNLGSTIDAIKRRRQMLQGM